MIEEKGISIIGIIVYSCLIILMISISASYGIDIVGIILSLIFIYIGLKKVGLI